MRPPRTGELELISPPYPVDEINAVQLYECMKNLVSWLGHYAEASNRFIGKPDAVPKPRALASLSAHVGLPLVRLMHMGQQMRSLRKAWDHLVRTHENDWASDKAENERHGLLRYAVEVIDCAYMSMEMLEAREEQCGQQQAMAFMGHLSRFFKHGQQEEEDDCSG